MSRNFSKHWEWQNPSMKPNLLGFFSHIQTTGGVKYISTPKKKLEMFVLHLQIGNLPFQTQHPSPPQTNLTAGQQCQTSCLKDDVHVENQPQTMRQTEMMLIERSLEVQTSDNMERWKAEQGSRVRRKSRAGKWSQKKVSWKTEYICANVSKNKIQVCEVLGKSQIVVLSQWFQMSKKGTPLWHEALLQVKMCKTHHGWTIS